MYRRFKAFIGVTIIALSVFLAPASLLVAPQDGNPVIAVQQNIVFAQEGEAASDQCGFSQPEWCIAAFFEYVVFWSGFYLAELTGYILDFFLDYSISSSTYGQGSDFVHRGWALVRDIANIFFIFVLLYIAIGTILNLDSVDTKKMLVKVIIIALLINFSLFFTKVVIDASNILARSFISSIDINVTDSDGNPIESDNTQFSAAIMAAFEPQRLIDTGDGSPFGAYQQENSSSGIAILIVLYVIGGVVLWAIALTFFTVAFMFLGRVIELWILMITAPIAFISIIVPFRIPRFGKDDWFKNLFSRAFVAPVFLFFMYLIIMFLDTGFIDGIQFTAGDSVWEIVLQVVIPFAILFVLVKTSKKIAMDMSGEIAGALGKAAGFVGKGALMVAGGAALGAGAGLAAAGGRATLGRMGASMAKSKMTGRTGRLMRGLGEKMETSSMDWRQSPTGQNIMKRMGVSNFAGNAFSYEGGRKGAKERYEKRRMEDAQQFVENKTSASRSTLEDMEDNMTRFNEIFGEEIKDLEAAVVDARNRAKDNTDPALQAGLDAALQTAQSNLDAKTNNVQPGFTDSYSTMKQQTRAQKQTVATETVAAREDYASSIIDEKLTGQPKKVKEGLKKKIRFNRKTNAKEE